MAGGREGTRAKPGNRLVYYILFIVCFQNRPVIVECFYFIGYFVCGQIEHILHYLTSLYLPYLTSHYLPNYLTHYHLTLPFLALLYLISPYLKQPYIT